MNKNETIIAVMEAFDEVERLKAENKELRRRDIAATMKVDGLTYTIDQAEKDTPRWHEAIYTFGRRQIWEKYGDRRYYRMDVSVKTNDDGTKSVEPFGRWYKDAYTEFPDFMSREDFLYEFEEELRAKYEEKRAEALED